MSVKGGRDEKPDFETLYEAYYDKVFRYAYSILLNRENAEDVVSDTFMAAYFAYDRYDPDISSPATWLTRIAHNKAVDFVRSAAYRKQEGVTEAEEILFSEDFAKEVETRETLLALYSQLTRAEREFLNLRYAMDLKDAEIAALYGLPVKTVNKRYQRLLAKCCRLLENE